jgi:hypothetical protein
VDQRTFERDRDALRAEMDRWRQQASAWEEERAGLLQRLKVLELERVRMQAAYDDMENRLRKENVMLTREAAEVRRQSDAACLRHGDLERQVEALRLALDHQRQQPPAVAQSRNEEQWQQLEQEVERYQQENRAMRQALQSFGLFW